MLMQATHRNVFAAIALDHQAMGSTMGRSNYFHLELTDGNVVEFLHLSIVFPPVQRDEVDSSRIQGDDVLSEHALAEVRQADLERPIRLVHLNLSLNMGVTSQSCDTH